jgi:hypothetical protein
MPDLLLYESSYSNDTLPHEHKFLFSNSVAKLFNYIKDKPLSKIKLLVNSYFLVNGRTKKFIFTFGKESIHRK